MASRVIVHVATFAGRERNVGRVVCDLNPQCDEIRVYDNSLEEVEDKGDAGKFFGHTDEGYHLTVDDDLYYPEDYVERLVTWIDYFACPVSFHGAQLDHAKAPWDRYFRGARKKVFRCLGTVEKAEIVDVPGTGTFGYHSDQITFSIDDFGNGFMADIWVAKKLKECGVRCMVAPHPEGWIRHQEIDHSTSLWERYNNNDQEQTRVANEIFSRDLVGV